MILPNVTDLFVDLKKVCTSSIQQWLISIECNDELKLLNQSKSGGCDYIPPAFLKNYANTLAYTLYYIFNKSLQT